MNAGLYTFLNRPQAQAGIEQKPAQKVANSLQRPFDPKRGEIRSFCHFLSHLQCDKNWIPVAVRMEKVRRGNLDPLRPLDNAPALG